MAGHSKWKNIQRTKGANDLVRAKEFTKLARAIEVAAQSGPDPKMNSILADAIDRAKKTNLSKEKIENAIVKGSGNSKNSQSLFEITYEGYAPFGVMVIVDCLTDNKNRTITDLRTYFGKNGGRVVDAGAISWQFQTVGQISFFINQKYNAHLNFEDLTSTLIDISGITDFDIVDDQVLILTQYESFHSVKETLMSKGIQIEEAKIIKYTDALQVLSPEHEDIIHQFIAGLEEIDDVSEVWVGAKLYEASR